MSPSKAPCRLRPGTLGHHAPFRASSLVEKNEEGPAWARVRGTLALPMVTSFLPSLLPPPLLLSPGEGDNISPFWDFARIASNRDLELLSVSLDFLDTSRRKFGPPPQRLVVYPRVATELSLSRRKVVFVFTVFLRRGI